MKIGQHKVFSGNHSPVRLVVLGVVVSGVVGILLTLLLTSLVLDGKVGENSTAVPVFMVRAVSVFIGCVVATAIRKEKHLMTIGLVMLGYFVILSGVCIVAYEGAFSKVLAGILSVVLGGVGSWLLRLKPSKNRLKLSKYTA